jgi:hypothetical protein
MSLQDIEWDHLPSNAVDIGENHWYAWVGWSPDRDLNPQYEGIEDTDKYGVSVGHLTPEGEPCQSFATVKGSIQIALAVRAGKETPMWDLIQEEPLTLSPSLLCRRCGDHGFIRESRWVVA